MPKTYKKQEPTKAPPASHCGENHEPKKCHWTITKDDGSAIIGRPLRTKDECVTTIQFHNMSGVTPQHHFNQYQKSSYD